MKDKPLKIYSLEEMLEKHIGKPGTPKREVFENELRLDLLGKSAVNRRVKIVRGFKFAINLQPATSKD